MALEKNERFALRLGEQFASVAGLDTLAGELEDLREEAEGLSTLPMALDEMRQFDREGGDFGAEIVGPILLPVLIEAGKQLWAKYVEKMAEKGAAKLADLTVDEVQRHVSAHWKDQESGASSEYENLLIAEAERQNLPRDRIDALLSAVRKELSSDVQPRD